MSDWRIKHDNVIQEFLHELNQDSDSFVLKGDTALKQCYGLDRFSEGIALDSINGNIIPFAMNFCQKHHYELKITKDTKTVKRCLIKYNDTENQLKVEVSYRRRNIPQNEITKVNGITVYSIDRIAQMKATAYSARDKIRDLYDISFICNKYFDSLSPATKSFLCDSLSQKGLEKFDYLVKTQSDPLIDTNKLASDFLEATNKLGILFEDDEQQLVDSYKKNKYKTKEGIADLIIQGVHLNKPLYMVERGIHSKMVGTLSEKEKLLEAARNLAAQKDEKVKEAVKSRNHGITHMKS